MPIKQGKDVKGYYYRWGNHGKKYYFRRGDERSKLQSYIRAWKQSEAAHANGYMGK